MTRTIALPVPSTAVAAAAVRRIWDRGDALLPLDPTAPAAAVAALLSTLRPDRLASLDDLDGTALDAPLPTADGTALVVATSGSTGAPKGVVLSAAALGASTTASLARLRCVDGEVWRVPLPLHHVAGLMALRRSWALGTEPDVVAPGDVAAWGGPGADHVALVPTQLHRCLDGAGTRGWRPGRDRLHDGGPRTVLLGGGPAPAGLLDRARAAGLHVVTSYGMSETCGGCVYDGLPLDGVEVSLAPDDRIRLRGEVRFDGYRGDPAATAAAIDGDGWFTSGDLGALDDHGRVRVLGRADAVVVTGGENVPLPPVVAALRAHPAVADAAAVGVPDPEWGAVVRAVIVPRDAAPIPTLAELRAHVRASLPAAHAPRQLAVVDTLPRDAMGKVTDATLRDLPTG